MSTQYSSGHRTNAMTQLIGDAGPSPIIKVFTGSVPATCATADSGTLLLTYQGGGSVAVTQPTTALTAANSNILNMTNTTGVVVGQQISGAGIVAGSTVLAVAANTTVTMSLASTAGVANTTTITFGAALGTSSGGVMTASAVSAVNAAAAGTAGYFRIYPNAATTTNAVAQGTVFQTTVISTNALTAANSNVLNFASTTGLSVGMAISGTGIIAGSTIISLTGTTVNMSLASTAGVANAASITFGGDMSMVNTTLTNGQSVNFTSLTVTANGA